MNRRRQGFSLPLALLLCTVLMFVGIAMAGVATNQLSLAKDRIHVEQAQAAADGGVVQALAALAASPSYSGNSIPAMVGEGPESYTIEVLRAAARLPDGQIIPAGCVYITSTGSYLNSARQKSCALVQLGSTSAFKGLRGIWATALTLDNGASVDSYDSAKGSYGGNNRGSNGSVSTNSVAPGSIKIEGGARIAGPVYVGPGGLIDARPNGSNTAQNSTLWYDRGTSYSSGAVMTEAVTIPTIDAPGAVGTGDVSLDSKDTTLAPGSYRDVNISNGARITLKPGAYIFRNLTLQGGARIVLAGPGPVQVYVSSQFDLGNGVHVSDSATSPSLFQLYMGDKSHYSQSGGTDISAIVYGPTATIDISNGAYICGAVVGQVVTMDGSASVHFDESLSSFSLGGPSSGAGTNKVLFRQRL